MTKIPKIEIKEVYVPKIRLWEVQPPILDVIYKPVVDIPGCVDAHRNNLTGLINEDELGTYQACGTFNIPSFEPLEYNPADFQYTEPAKQQEQQQKQAIKQQYVTNVQTILTEKVTLSRARVLPYCTQHPSETIKFLLLFFAFMLMIMIFVVIIMVIMVIMVIMIITVIFMIKVFNN